MMASLVVPGLTDEATRRAAWLAARRTAITGTDAGKILSGKGYQVWADKTLPPEPEPDRNTLPDYMLAGNYFERGALTWYADREQVGLEFADTYQFVKHPAAPVGCTFDAFRVDRGFPVDAKIVHRWTPYDATTSTGWGEPGSALVPLGYATQLAVQMAVRDVAEAHLAVFFRGDGNFAIYRVFRDRAMESQLLEFLHGWWHRHIIEGVQPAPDESERAKAILSRLPQTTEQIRVATPEEDGLILRHVLAHEDVKAAEEEKDTAANLLRAAVGADLGIAGRNGKVTFKANAPSTKTDWEKAARSLVQVLTQVKGPEFASQTFGRAMDDATTTTTGNRVLRVTTPKGTPR